MPRSRPASDPLSFHEPTGQYDVTRGGKRVFLGADGEQALARYHRLAPGEPVVQASEGPASAPCTLEELANRFLAAQQANWRNRNATLQCYKGWLKRFLRNERGVLAREVTVAAD